MIEEFVSRVFALRNAAHLAHWAAKGPGSFARHSALVDFYDGVIDRVDDIVECYQGCYGLIGDVKQTTYARDDIEDVLIANANWIAENRKKIARDNEILENLLDDLGALFAKTAYKLRFLQ